MELLRGKIMDTSRSEQVSTKLQQIATLARNAPDMVMTNLAHHIDIDLLQEAWRLVRKDGAVGVDGQTATEYARNLQANLTSLLARFKSGQYRAPPVRRVYIPKGDGKLRPLGIPTLEDKILQTAVKMVLEAVYEQDFSDCSYGYRPGRSAHQALETLWRKLMLVQGGYILDVDIKSFFDTLDHAHLRAFLDLRVRDGVIRRTIDKWLKAGVMEEGNLVHVEAGTPQGGVVSPLLANLYLHHVLDLWFEREVKPRVGGLAFLIRYADDFVIVCSREQTAHLIMEVLPKRFGRYGLTLHPDKTRLVRFRPPQGWPTPRPGDAPPETFDLLGFTHYWGLSKKGRPAVMRKTAKSRFARTLKRIGQACRAWMHEPVEDQQAMLNRKLQGHDAYFGITGNYPALRMLRRQVERLWRKWLDRRGGKRPMTWERFKLLLRYFPLTPPRVAASAMTRA
jgi:RNA-directed DNA polymerase